MRRLLSATTILLLSACDPGPVDENFLDSELEEVANDISGITCAAGAVSCSGAGSVWTTHARVGRDASQAAEVAQTFAVTTAGTPSQVRLKLRLLRDLTAGADALLRVQLRDVTGGGPVHEAPSFAEATVAVSTLPRRHPVDTDLAFLPIGAPVALQVGNTYALVLSLDAPSAGSALVGVSSLKADWAGGALTFRRTSTASTAGAFTSPSAAGDLSFSLTLNACATQPASPWCSIAYDGFDYPAATLNGRNGGTGWTAPWSFTYSADFLVVSPGETYPGLTTTGSKVSWYTAGAYGIAQERRNLARQSSGKVYVQFMSQFGQTGSGTPNLRLYDSTTTSPCGGALSGGFGNNGGATMCILNCNLDTTAGSCSSAPLANLNLVLARIDYDAVEVRMWANPDLTTFDYANPPAASAVWPGVAPKFDSVEMICRSPCSFDELRIFAPPN